MDARVRPALWCAGSKSSNATATISAPEANASILAVSVRGGVRKDPSAAPTRSDSCGRSVEGELSCHGSGRRQGGTRCSRVRSDRR